MDMKGVKNMKFATKVVEGLAKKSTQATFYFTFHQPKAPKCLIKK